MRNIFTSEKSEAADSDALDADLFRVRSILEDWGRKRSLRDPLSAICEELDFSAPQIHCLMWVGLDKALTMGEISHRIGISEKTCTGLIDRLENAGHLRRERDQADRRVVRVRLTEAGLRLYEAMDAAIDAKFRLMLSVLEAPDRKSLCSILEKLRDRLSSFVEPSGEES